MCYLVYAKNVGKGYETSNRQLPINPLSSVYLSILLFSGALEKKESQVLYKIFTGHPN